MLNLKYLFMCVLALVATPAYSAHILGIVPTPSYSHQLAFKQLWKELSLRGHQVTIMTTNPIKDPSLKNLTEIDLSYMYKHWSKFDSNSLADLSVFEVIDWMVNTACVIIDEQLEHPDMQKLLKNKNEHFDVVLVETLFPGMAAFAERFNCPLIQIFSLDAPSMVYYMIGNPTHPVLNPDFMLPFYGKLTFIERLMSTMYLSLTVLYYKYRATPVYQALVDKHFGTNYPSLEKILTEASLMFVNTDFVFHPIRPLSPNIIQIGGGTHLAKPKPLPKELQTILDGASNGFIYFSLGSSVKSKHLPEKTRKIFLETFSELPYTILWKFEQEDLPDKPDNVIISNWFPQQDVFRHPNIKLFISQGGLQSMDEATHNHIPIVGIPFFGDQESNVGRMVDKGIGLGLSVDSLDKSALKKAILEVIDNPRYRNRVKELAELVKDQPMTGLERAVWWTEYVIRHKGAKHLRNPAIDLPLYQYFLLDVIAFVLAVIVIAIYVLARIVKLILRCIRYVLRQRKVKTQ